MNSIIAFLAMWFAIGPAMAAQGMSVPTDTSGLVTSSGLAAAIAAAQAAPTPTVASVPTAGPGTGCAEFWVPSSAVGGTAGTCSKILMCGTSPTYITEAMNIGSGCP